MESAVRQEQVTQGSDGVAVSGDMEMYANMEIYGHGT